VVLAVLLFIEVAAYMAAKVLLSVGLMAGKPDISGYAEYLEARDPVLGWPSPKAFGQGEFDASGSRIVPAFPDPDADTCVALFGDSFTWGDEVSAADAYGNVLAGKLGCRVANYGVGGYGTDQSVIRYAEVIETNAPIVVLGHFSDNILRNVNSLRDFLAGGRFGFKPQYTFGAEGLERQPLPLLKAEQYSRVAFDAPELLPFEYFAPGTAGGPGIMRFPYSFAVFGALSHYRLSAVLAGIRPTYRPFYDRNHPSGALMITAAVIRHAAAVARHRQQRFFLLLIPDVHDLKAMQSGRSASYQPLQALIGEQGIAVIDSGDYIVKTIAARDPCQIFLQCGSSHFTPEGYSLLADAVHDRLRSDSGAN
jgi:hypothetical protein